MRVLQVDPKKTYSDREIGCMRFDPFEGTARASRKSGTCWGRSGCMRFDPFEGTARTTWGMGDFVDETLHEVRPV